MSRRFGLAQAWATVVAYDPGGTTGWAVVAAEAESLGVGGASLRTSIRHSVNGEITGELNQQCSNLLDLISAWPSAAVVGESFLIRQFNQADYFLSPIKINAVIDFSISQGQRRSEDSHPRELFYQSPSMAKSTISDDQLREYKMYHHNSPHARDASRHAITFLRRASGGSKESDKLRKSAWPHLFGE